METTRHRRMSVVRSTTTRSTGFCLARRQPGFDSRRRLSIRPGTPLSTWPSITTASNSAFSKASRLTGRRALSMERLASHSTTGTLPSRLPTCTTTGGSSRRTNATSIAPRASISRPGRRDPRGMVESGSTMDSRRLNIRHGPSPKSSCTTGSSRMLNLRASKITYEPNISFCRSNLIRRPALHLQFRRRTNRRRSARSNGLTKHLCRPVSHSRDRHNSVRRSSLRRELCLRTDRLSSRHRATEVNRRKTSTCLRRPVH